MLGSCSLAPVFRPQPAGLRRFPVNPGRWLAHPPTRVPHSGAHSVPVSQITVLGEGVAREVG